MPSGTQRNATLRNIYPEDVRRTHLEGVYLFEDVRRVLGRQGGGRRQRDGPRALAYGGRQYVDQAARVVVALERVGAHEPGGFQHCHPARALPGHAVAAVPDTFMSLVMEDKHAIHTFITI